MSIYIDIICVSVSGCLSLVSVSLSLSITLSPSLSLTHTHTHTLYHRELAGLVRWLEALTTTPGPTTPGTNLLATFASAPSLLTGKRFDARAPQSSPPPPLVRVKSNHSPIRSL